MSKGFWVAILSVATMLTVSAGAQDGRYELGGSVGRIFISDQGIQYLRRQATVSGDVVWVGHIDARTMGGLLRLHSEASQKFQQLRD